MEDVLDLYEESFDEKRPVVCFDEKPVQMLDDVLAPISATPGRAKRQDYEYERKGTSNLFVFLQPLAGWREIKVIIKKIELHHTPKHGSWLNMAEIEISVLEGQCLKRRIGSKESLEKETAAYVSERNAKKAKILWGFSVQDARAKMKRVYP